MSVIESDDTLPHAPLGTLPVDSALHEPKAAWVPRAHDILEYLAVDSRTRYLTMAVAAGIALIVTVDILRKSRQRTNAWW